MPSVKSVSKKNRERKAIVAKLSVAKKTRISAFQVNNKIRNTTRPKMQLSTSNVIIIRFRARRIGRKDAIKMEYTRVFAEKKMQRFFIEE